MKKQIGWCIAFLAGILLAWQLLVTFGDISPWMLPGPWDVVLALVENSALIGQHALQTVFEALVGLTLALAMGIALAVAMTLQPWIKAGLEPVLVVSQTIPIVTIYPLLMIWLGYGVLPKIVVVALVCFFPVAISLVDGMARADSDLAEWMKQMGGGKWQILWKLRLPWAMPQLVSGMKVAATYSVMGAVVGEWMGASQGLGVYINRSANSFLVARVFAAIVVIVVVSLILYGIIELAARLGMPWYYSNLKEGQN